MTIFARICLCILYQLWQKYYAIGQIIIVINGQKLNSTLAIWSHWSQPTCYFIAPIWTCFTASLSFYYPCILDLSLSHPTSSLSLSLSLSPLPHTLTFKASVCLCMPLCPFLLTIHFDHLSTCHKTLTVYQVCILLLPWPSFSSDYLSFYPSVISSYLRNPTLQSIVFFYLLVPTTRRTDSAINFFLLEFILSQPIYRPLFLSYL